MGRSSGSGSWGRPERTPATGALMVATGIGLVKASRAAGGAAARQRSVHRTNRSPRLRKINRPKPPLGTEPGPRPARNPVVITVKLSRPNQIRGHSVMRRFVALSILSLAAALSAVPSAEAQLRRRSDGLVVNVRPRSFLNPGNVVAPGAQVNPASAYGQY